MGTLEALWRELGEWDDILSTSSQQDVTIGHIVLLAVVVGAWISIYRWGGRRAK